MTGLLEEWEDIRECVALISHNVGPALICTFGTTMVAHAVKGRGSTERLPF